MRQRTDSRLELEIQFKNGIDNEDQDPFNLKLYAKSLTFTSGKTNFLEKTRNFRSGHEDFLSVQKAALKRPAGRKTVENAGLHIRNPLSLHDCQQYRIGNDLKQFVSDRTIKIIREFCKLGPVEIVDNPRIAARTQPLVEAATTRGRKYKISGACEKRLRSLAVERFARAGLK